VEVKEHRLLLEAFSKLLHESPRTVLLLAGDGPLASTLMDQARILNVDANIRFLGHRADVERVLAALDVFVLSSRSEGLSNTILEAMASGVAVVATAVGGASELVVHGETGLLTVSGDADSLASAISLLIRDGGMRARLASAARERAIGEFGLSRMIDGYTALYERLYSLRVSQGMRRPIPFKRPSLTTMGSPRNRR
jgi:glycosyltransferase involved in cell wall biosynthesis